MVSHGLRDSVSPWVILRMSDHKIYDDVVIPLVEFDLYSLWARVYHLII